MRTIGFTDKGQRIELTTNELVDLLKTQERGTFFWMRTETKPKMNVKDNPYTVEVVKVSPKGRTTISHVENIVKVTEGCYLMGNNYRDRVEKENELDEYIPNPCKVGEHISKCVLHNDNTGKDYLQYEVYVGDKPNSQYFFNGDIIEKKLFESYLVVSKPNPLGVTFPSVTISNIKEIRFGGNQYVVVNPTVETPTEQGVNTVEV